MILIHDTASIISLYSILESSTLKSSTGLGISGTGGQDPDFIYFTPASDDFIFDYPQETFVFDFDAMLNKYKKFFINSSNSYGPIDGTMKTEQNCDCIKTFYSEALLQTEKNKLSSHETPCLVRSLQEMLDYILSSPQNENAYLNSRHNCEGGPEVGFYENNISLLGCLRSVRIRSLDFFKSSVYYSKEIPAKLNMSIDETYNKILKKINELGAEVVIVDAKNRKGGRKHKKSIKKSTTRKKNKKTKKQKNKKIKK